MLNEEARKKEEGDASSSNAYVAESHDKKEARGRGQARFQQSKDQKRSKSRKRQEITCFYCGKPNHKKVDCRIYKRDLAEGKVANKNEQKGENGVAMTAEYEQGEDYLIIED
jgi:hypothetical protein